MTTPEPPPRREGTTEDIAGLRLYYRVDGVEQHIDWDPNRGPTIAEAIAVKKATASDVTPSRMIAVLQRSAAADDDPEALQALVWMIRRFRMREDLRITAFDGLDLLSVRPEYIDAHGVELDMVDPDPTPEDAALAADIAADIMRHLPTLEHREALTAAASLVRAAPAPQAGPGEGEAGAEPADPAPTPPDEDPGTIPTT